MSLKSSLIGENERYLNTYDAKYTLQKKISYAFPFFPKTIFANVSVLVCKEKLNRRKTARKNLYLALFRRDATFFLIINSPYHFSNQTQANNLRGKIELKNFSPLSFYRSIQFSVRKNFSFSLSISIFPFC